MGDEANPVLKLAVIGAGPHALAVICRLLEPNPEGYAEEPGNTNLFSQSKEGKTFGKYVDNRRSKTDRQIRALMAAKREVHPLIREGLVQCFDPFGEWMGKWEHQFQALDIPVLRSHANLHSDPIDVECLQVYAAQNNRKDELWPLQFAERTDEYHGPFLLPSKPLFTDFQRSLVKRYGIENLVQKKRVVDVDIIGDSERFRLHFDVGEPVECERLVITVGSTNHWQRSLPDWVDPEIKYPHSALRHTTDLFETFPAMSFMNPTVHSDPIIEEEGNRAPAQEEEVCEGQAPPNPLKPSRAGKRLLIVGGGLTSAQLSIRAKNLGYERVVLVTRGELKPKHFDLDLRWIGPYRNQMLGEYWSSDLETRSAMLKRSRGGASVTPPVLVDFRKRVGAGELEVKESTEVWDATYDEGSQSWTVDLSDETSDVFDTVWLATGSSLDISREPMFKKLLSHFEVDVVCGLPALANTLELKEGCGVYLLGAYAAFQLGPDALNLAGGMSGSSRIVPRLQKEMGIELEPLPVHASIFTDATSSDTGGRGGGKGKGSGRGRKKKRK